MTPDPTQPVTNQDAAILRPGDKVDPYTIKRQVGSGGSSVVFKATDELLGRDVAIKQFLLAGAQDEVGLREKIMTEARLHQKAAEAVTDRLVQVVDVIDSPHGLLLISEYIAGPSLEQILAQNPDPMDVKQALGIIAATAQALEAIHGQGIVHLDLKPANILMPRTGGLKISDFGLATDRADHTLPTAGTFRYMAPELLNHDKVDHRADLYALGIMAYEMLAGRAKFDEAFKLILKDQRNQAMRWIKWHTNPRAKPPALAELVPGIPPAVADLVERLMDKDPETRMGSAKEILRAIKRHFAGKDIPDDDVDTETQPELKTTATAPGDTTVLPKQRKPRKIAIIIASIIIVLGTGGYVAYSVRNASLIERDLLTVRELFPAADLAYRNGEYDQAASLYEDALNHVFAHYDKYENHYGLYDSMLDPNRRHAEAGLNFSKGQVALKESRFEDATAYFKHAGSIDDKYTERARALIDETRQAKAFADTVARVESHIENRSFGEARKELDAWRDLAATEQEQQTLRSLGAKLEDQLARHRVQELIREANELTLQGKRDEAIELLKASPQKVGVREMLERLEADATAEQAVALADAALQRNDAEEAIKQLEIAAQAKPEDAALRQRLTQVRSDWLIEEGLRMLAQGNTVGADEKLTEALGYQPDNQRARDALKRIASNSRRQSFIDAGDAAAGRRDYATAETQYNNALALGVDDELSDKLTQVRIQILLEKSRAALRDGRIDEANDLINQAQQLDLESPDAAAVRHEVEIRGEYVRHLKAGDEARDRSSFGEAKRHYLRAKEAMDTPEVQTRLDETEFDHLLAQARDFIAAKEYASARAQLQIAAGIRMTDEVKALYDQLQAEDPDALPLEPQ